MGKTIRRFTTQGWDVVRNPMEPDWWKGLEAAGYDPEQAKLTLGNTERLGFQAAVFGAAEDQSPDNQYLLHLEVAGRLDIVAVQDTPALLRILADCAQIVGALDGTALTGALRFRGEDD